MKCLAYDQSNSLSRGAHSTFLFPFPGRIKQIMSPRFIMHPCDDPVAIRIIIARVIYPGHGRFETRPWVSTVPFSSPFPPPFFSTVVVRSCTDRRGIQNASAPRSMPRITSRTRTLTAIADLYFRDPYYLNAGALLLAGWYPRDRNIPRHNEPRGQPLSLTNLQHKKKKRISRLEASFDSRERGIQVFQQIATTLVNRDLARDWKVGFG